MQDLKPEEGILIETSIANVINLLNFNTKNHIIITQLDDKHLFVDKDKIEMIRNEI